MNLKPDLTSVLKKIRKQSMNECLISNSTKLDKIIDLGMHPFADTFINKKDFGKPEPVYPLQCYLCKETGQVQVGYITQANERYNLYDYSYTSSNSKFARNHWKKCSREVIEKTRLSINSTIIEIGSNDGYLCKQFKILGYSTFGVDSSKYIADIAIQNGIETFCCIFDREQSKNVKNHFGGADLVIANNVFNHSNDPVDFARGVYDLLNEGGIFVYELPYWFSTIKTKKFDQIYHEHISYFTVKSSFNLLSKASFEIIDVQEVDYHGGSIRVYARKISRDKTPYKNDIVSKMINEEENFGLFEVETYHNFMKEITHNRDKFLSNLYKIRSQGYPIIGVGAAAKGNTFLNFYNLDSSVLEFITDASIYKQGKFTPSTRIPITGDEIFGEYDKVYALILSWNISNIIKEKLKEFNKNIKFLTLGER